MTAPRLLYLPNEPVLGWQTGPRRYFETLARKGDLAAYEAFSFEFEADRKGADTVRHDLYNTVANFRPDIILWQHISSFPVPGKYLTDLKNLPSRPTLVWHEADMYGSPFEIKTPSEPMRALARDADLVFVVGLGRWRDRLRRMGARNIRYAPHFYDPALFGGDWEPTPERKFDVLLIGNRIRSRVPLPFRAIPGARTRETLARRLHQAFGDRFGLYGRGWDDTGFSSGALDFKDQQSVIRDSWITVIWDHFDTIPFYFSDRLPISLAAGVLHVANYHEGYETMFNNGEHLAWCRSVDEMVDTVRYYLSLPRETLNQLGRNGQAYARQTLTADAVMGEMLREIIRHRDTTFPQTRESPARDRTSPPAHADHAHPYPPAAAFVQSGRSPL